MTHYRCFFIAVYYLSGNGIAEYLPGIEAVRLTGISVELSRRWQGTGSAARSAEGEYS